MRLLTWCCLGRSSYQQHKGCSTGECRRFTFLAPFPAILRPSRGGDSSDVATFWWRSGHSYLDSTRASRVARASRAYGEPRLSRLFQAYCWYNIVFKLLHVLGSVNGSTDDKLKYWVMGLSSVSPYGMKGTARPLSSVSG
jgi:hypothetical protein